MWRRKFGPCSQKGSGEAPCAKAERWRGNFRGCHNRLHGERGGCRNGGQPRSATAPWITATDAATVGSHGWQPRRAWITALRHGSHLGSHLGGPPPRPRRACATDHTLDHSPRHGGQPRMLPYSHGQPRSATVPWITNPRRARIPSKSLRRSNRLRGCQGRATGLKPISERARNKSLVETGLTPTWELANGQKTAKARLAAEGQQVPDSEHGIVETRGDVSLRPPQLHAISLSAITNWRLRSPATEDAFLQADGFGRGVSVRAPGG